MKIFDTIIIGGGASGLMCALSATNRNKTVCLLDCNASLGRKITISGGGRCNFTNLKASSQTYLSNNPHFCKSALAQFKPSDFLDLVQKNNIDVFEKTPGQYFCKNSAQDIIDLLFKNINYDFLTLKKNAKILSILKKNDLFEVITKTDTIMAKKCVIATGGLSYPSLGASNFGYEIAKQFGLGIVPPTPALVPLIFSEAFSNLAGVSLPVTITHKNKSFTDNILFTHNGLSGPAILQISSYTSKGDSLSLCFCPDLNWPDFLSKNIKKELKNALSDILPKRFVLYLIENNIIQNIPIKQMNQKQIDKLINTLTHFTLTPTKTAGYTKAEVTKGGVSTTDLNSKTMGAKNVDGLYFIGEVVDVTGHLGGYNLQWAWSSGWVAGQNI